MDESKANDKESENAKANDGNELQGKSIETLPQSEKLMSPPKLPSDVKSVENSDPCPQDFVRVGSTCYYISLAKVCFIFRIGGSFQTATFSDGLDRFSITISIVPIFNRLDQLLTFDFYF